MAGDWIKLEHCTPDKPEVFIMAGELDLDADAVLGKLCRVWIWADQQTLDGNACNAASVTKALPPALLDRIAGVTGFASAMLSVGWLVETDQGLSFPNFQRHNGQTAKSRGLTAKRVAKNRQNVTQSATEMKRNCNARSVTEALPEKRREEKSKNTETASAVSCPQETCEPDDAESIRNESGEIFPLAGGRTWELPAQRLAEYDAAYRLDVRRELAKAREWLRDRPERRPKSGRGMKQFLTGWLNRASPAVQQVGSGDPF